MHLHVNLMPISVYWLLYKDPDCTKLAPGNRVAVKTYTIEKIKVVVSNNLFVVHPDTRCLIKKTFQVTCHEGSVIVSCGTSLALGLIQPHNNLDSTVPDSCSLISSKADHSLKEKSKKIVSVSKLSNNVNSRDEQSPAVSRVQGIDVNQCVNQEGKVKYKQQQHQVQTNTVSDDKNDQKKTSEHMRQLKPNFNEMQSKEPAIKYKKRYRKDQNNTLCYDKNCQVTKNLCVRSRRAHLPSILICDQ